MKRQQYSILKAICLAIFCAGFISVSTRAQSATAQAQSVTAQSREIRKMKAAELAAYISQSDHPLIVNFWATFCEPCNNEIPYFQRIAGEYKSKGVELLLVSLDLPDYYPRKISDFAKKRNYSASFAWLNETNADVFCPIIDPKWSGGIPASLFINNKTHYRRFFDRQLTELQAVQTIKELAN